MAALARYLFPLAKPRIVLLLVFVAAAGAWKAAGGQPEPTTMLAVIVAVAVSAAGSNLINQGLEADIDAVMQRTRGRAVASRQVNALAVIAAGLVLVAAAVAALAVATNLLAALLTLAAAAVYVLVYTVVLKRRSWNNIVIGGAAGAFPPLIGAAAVSGHVDAPGLYMFAFIFFWTPPHFWTLSLMLRSDYAAAKIPMLGAIASRRDTAIQIKLYILLLAALTWLPLAAGYGGVAFGLAGTLLTAYWLRASWPLRKDPSPERTLAAYKFSLLYLALVFLVLAIEPMLPWYA
jgi:protoheme IX farnesyltransferase